MTEPVILSIAEPIFLKTVKEINSLYYGILEIKKDDYIKTESYLEFDDELWVARRIRKKMIQGLVTFLVTIEHNMCELNRKSIAAFDITAGPAAFLEWALTGTRWTMGVVSGVTGDKRVKSKKRISVLKSLWLAAAEWNGEFDFHSKTRKVDFKNQIGNAIKIQPIRYDKNCDYIVREEDATELLTRLYIYGADDMTVTSANPTTKEYIDSANIGLYPDPIEDTVYTTIATAADLYAYGLAYLGLYDDEIFRYDINIADMTVFRVWSAEGVHLGDTARVQNLDLKLNIDVRVKKITKDFIDPNQFIIELDNVHDNMARRLANWYDKLTEIAPYDDEPGTVDPDNIPGYGDNYDDPIPTKGIYTIGTGVVSWAGTLTNERAITRDGNGNFHAVWVSGDGSNDQVFYGKSVDDGMTWTSQQITTPDAFYVKFQHPSIAIDSSNNIYIVCGASLGSRISQVLLYVSPDNGSTFNALIEVPFGSFYNSAPSIGIDKNDVVHVINMRYYAGGRIEHISSTDGGGTWGAKTTVLESVVGNIRIIDTDPHAFEISWDASSVMHVGIRAIVYIPADTYHIIYLNSSDGGATWGNQVVLNKSIYNQAACPRFAVGFHNYSLYYIWEEIEGGISNIYLNKCTNDVWGTPELVSDGINDCYDPTVSLDSIDKLYVSWTAQVGLKYQIKLKVKISEAWSAEFTRTISDIDKRRPHLAHAQNPTINGLKPCVIYNGFVMMYEEYTGVTSDMKFWIDCSEIF